MSLTIRNKSHQTQRHKRLLSRLAELVTADKADVTTEEVTFLIAACTEITLGKQ